MTFSDAICSGRTSLDVTVGNETYDVNLKRTTVSSSYSAWQSNTPYSVGDKVTADLVEGMSYGFICIEAHTSPAEFTYDTGLWRALDNDGYVIESGESSYRISPTVRDGSVEYECPSASGSAVVDALFMSALLSDDWDLASASVESAALDVNTKVLTLGVEVGYPPRPDASDFGLCYYDAGSTRYVDSSDLTVSDSDGVYTVTCEGWDWERGNGAVLVNGELFGWELDPATLEVTSTAYDTDTSTLTIDATLGGYPIGADESCLDVFYYDTDGNLVQLDSSAFAVTKTGESTYEITVPSWSEDYNAGTVAAFGCSSEWEFAKSAYRLDSATLTSSWNSSDKTKVDNVIEITATFSGKYKGKASEFTWAYVKNKISYDFTPEIVSSEGDQVVLRYSFTDTFTDGYTLSLYAYYLSPYNHPSNWLRVTSTLSSSLSFYVSDASYRQVALKCTAYGEAISATHTHALTNSSGKTVATRDTSDYISSSGYYWFYSDGLVSGSTYTVTLSCTTSKGTLSSSKTFTYS